MNREPVRVPCETWEFFSACIHYLGKSALTSLFQRGTRQIERWSADPGTSGNQNNPLDRYEALLIQLMENGQVETARSAVARQAHITGCELIESEYPEPDKPTVELEIIDDSNVKAAYDSVLLNEKSTREECFNAMNKTINELKENYVIKCRKQGWKP